MSNCRYIRVDYFHFIAFLCRDTFRLVPSMVHLRADSADGKGSSTSLVVQDQDICQIAMGNLIGELLQHLSTKIDGRGRPGSPRLLLYSGHDTTLLPLCGKLAMVSEIHIQQSASSESSKQCSIQPRVPIMSLVEVLSRYWLSPKRDAYNGSSTQGQRCQLFKHVSQYCRCNRLRPRRQMGTNSGAWSRF